MPWKLPDHALVIDAYELNIIDWDAMLKDRRIAGFISKASDGLPESFACTGDHRGDTVGHCKTMWRKYAVSRELYQTRRLVARANGLLWGAYHLARPGNPIDQANHFLDYAAPRDDELMVLDVEGIDAEKYMSLEDAAIFAGHIKTRTGRYPMLYTNHVTATYIAANRARFPILSRLPLWYARYKPGIRNVFPMGNWDSYTLWQFSAAPNCGRRRCPYRVAGTLNDIDVNVAAMNAKALRAIWANGELLPEKPLLIATGRGSISAGAGIDVDLMMTGSIRKPSGALALQ
nr:GH25 family lysozyme [Pararhizobium polonicum]